MLRKLRNDQDSLDATALVLAEWMDPPAFDGVALRQDLVPPDLAAGAFLARLIEAVLERTPVDMHVRVRERREQRNLEVDEADEAAE